MSSAVLHVFDYKTVNLAELPDGFEGFCQLVSQHVGRRRRRGRRGSLVYKYLDQDSEWITFSSDTEYGDISQYAQLVPDSDSLSLVHFSVTDVAYESRKAREVTQTLSAHCRGYRRNPQARYVVREMIRRDQAPIVAGSLPHSLIGSPAYSSDHDPEATPCSRLKTSLFRFGGATNPFLKLGGDYCRGDSCFEGLMQGWVHHIQAGCSTHTPTPTPTPLPLPACPKRKLLLDELEGDGYVVDRILNERLLVRFGGDLEKTRSVLDFIEEMLVRDSENENENQSPEE